MHLARRLAERSPVHHGDAVTLAVERDGVTTPLDPSVGLDDSGILSGATVKLSGTTGGTSPTGSESAAAVAVIVAGPGAGTRFPLRSGNNLVGRDQSCEVVLVDELVSRRHLRIEVSDDVEVIDLGSANGTFVGDRRVDRATVGPTTDILLGDTRIRVEAAGDGTPAGSTAFVRSPPALVPFVPDELEAPRVPTPERGGRIPVIAALAPVVLGAVMFLLTRRVESLIFIALSPIMLMGNARRVQDLRTTRSEEGSSEQFRQELDEFAAEGRRRLAARPTPGGTSIPSSPHSSTTSWRARRCCGRADPTATTSSRSPLATPRCRRAARSRRREPTTGGPTW